MSLSTLGLAVGTVAAIVPLFPFPAVPAGRGRAAPPVPVWAWPVPGGRGQRHVVPGPAPRPVRHVRSFRGARWRWRSPGPGLAAGAATAPSRGQGSASPAHPGAATVPFPRSGAQSGCVIFLSRVAAFPAAARAPRCSPVFPGAPRRSLPGAGGQLWPGPRREGAPGAPQGRCGWRGCGVTRIP